MVVPVSQEECAVLHKQRPLSAVVDTGAEGAVP